MRKAIKKKFDEQLLGVKGCQHIESVDEGFSSITFQDKDGDHETWFCRPCWDNFFDRLAEMHSDVDSQRELMKLKQSPLN